MYQVNLYYVNLTFSMCVTFYPDHQKNNVAWSKNCFECSVRVNKYHGRACTNHRLDYVSHLLKQENLQMPPRNSTLVGDEDGPG